MTTESSEEAEAPRLTMFKATVAHAAERLAEGLGPGQRAKPKGQKGQTGTAADAPDSDRLWPGSADQSSTRRAHSERKAITEYDQIKLGTQRQFITAAAAARPGTLVLQDFYDRTRTFKEPDADLIATLLAARTEANGRVWLNNIEGDVIAAALERTGKDLLAADLPRFAEAAFDEAANIHGKFKNSRAEDRCEYLKSGAHRRTYPWWNPMRTIWTLSWSLFGYGYKPMRLLIWIALTIAGFTVYMLNLPRVHGTPTSDAFFMAIQNFVNPMGLSDAKSVSASWEPALEVETYVGDILRNIFFVLLIRRWFRL